MKKRKEISIRLPNPANMRMKQRKAEKCEECKAVLARGKGYGYCETCYITTPLPIAKIITAGAHNGKYVYLKESILRQIREEYDDIEDINDALKKECHDRDFFIIEMLPEE